jgi:hypothetical protein
MKAAMGVADPTRKAAMTTDHDDEFEPHHSSSPTDQVLHELQLYGYRPFNDEPDPGRFRKRTPSPAASPTSSTLSWWRFQTLASNPTSRICSGRR